MPVVEIQRPFFDYEIPEKLSRLVDVTKRKSIRFRREWGRCVLCREEDLCVVFVRGLICKRCIEGALKDESEEYAGSLSEKGKD